MKKEIKIDTEDLINALEDHSDSFDYFLDLGNGNVALFSKESYEELSEDDTADSDKCNLLQVENDSGRFVLIDPVKSEESFGIMEDFVSTLPDDLIKDRLSSALSKRKPFRHFKDVLNDFPEVQKEWYKFHEEEMKKIAYEWLESYDIKAELIHKYVIEDKEKK